MDLYWQINCSSLGRFYNLMYSTKLIGNNQESFPNFYRKEGSDCVNSNVNNFTQVQETINGMTYLICDIKLTSYPKCLYVYRLSDYPSLCFGFIGFHVNNR